MDDLEMLTAVLNKPEPSDDVVNRGRDRLAQAIQGPARPNRIRQLPVRPQLPSWRVAAAGLAAASTVAALVVTATGGLTAPGHTGTAGRSTAASREAGQRILLDAATAVQQQRPAAYWHYDIRASFGAKSSQQTGYPAATSYQAWISAKSSPGCPVRTYALKGQPIFGFALTGSRPLTYQQTRRLPTTPAALEAWFARQDAGQPDVDGFVASAMLSLQYQVPAPPAVRAAAFSALASFPGVTSLGAAKGGEAIRISFPDEPGAQPVTLVFDSKTSLLRSQTTNGRTTTIEAANWTNRPPRGISIESTCL
jgi:hypothetical protein